jgi:hypothetical protein
VTAAHAADLLGAAMVDFATGRRSPAWLSVAPGRRLAHDLAAYFAPVTAPEQALLDLARPAGWRLQHAVTAGARCWAALSLDAPW